MEPQGLGREAAALKADCIFSFTLNLNVFRHVAFQTWRIIIKALHSNKNKLILNHNMFSHLKVLLLWLG